MRPPAILMRPELVLMILVETSSVPVARRSTTQILTAPLLTQAIKSFHVVWVGAKYAIMTDLDITAAYYFNYQPTYAAPVNCSPATTSPTCHGTLNAVSLLADWQFEKKFDAYAGFMFSQVNGGLASGFLNNNTFSPTAGLRFRF